MSSGSNRDNPLHKEYYQATADLIAIWWYTEFKPTLTEGVSSRIGFNPDTVLDSSREPVDIIKAYQESLLHAMHESWRGFIEKAQRDESGSIPVRELIKKVNELGLKVSYIRQPDGKYAEEVIPAGMQTGSETTTHLVSLFGEEFSPIIPLVISKVRLEHVGEARNQVGIAQPLLDGTVLPEPNYNLIQGRELSREGLRALGYGQTLGCPAGMRVSENVKKMLLERDVQMASSTMLEDLSRVLQEDFQRVFDWYESLPEDRKGRISEGARKLFDGSWRESAKNQEGECPYHRGLSERK